MSDPAVAEFELAQLPGDGITNVAFAPTRDFLLASSWDSSVSVYNVEANRLLVRYEHENAVLDCAWAGADSKTVSGGLDKKLMMFDLEKNVKSIIGGHDEAIKCVEWSTSKGLAVSAGWDGMVKLWDARSENPVAAKLTKEHHKVYTMSLAGENHLVVGCSGRLVVIYDLRNMNALPQMRESALRNQTRCIRCTPDGQGYVLSSIEGRVSVEFLDPSEQAQAQKYAFKCHRKNEGGVQTLYPVNAVAFHPKYGTFATGGCDRLVNVWDLVNKKRISQYPAYPTSVASLAYNSSGSLLAVASSYTFEQGEQPNQPADSIFIRRVKDSESMPKARRQK